MSTAMLDPEPSAELSPMWLLEVDLRASTVRLDAVEVIGANGAPLPEYVAGSVIVARMPSDVAVRPLQIERAAARLLRGGDWPSLVATGQLADLVCSGPLLRFTLA